MQPLAVQPRVGYLQENEDGHGRYGCVIVIRISLNRHSYSCYDGRENVMGVWNTIYSWLRIGD